MHILPISYFMYDERDSEVLSYSVRQSRAWLVDPLITSSHFSRILISLIKALFIFKSQMTICLTLPRSGPAKKRIKCDLLTAIIKCSQLAPIMLQGLQASEIHRRSKASFFAMPPNITISGYQFMY